MPHPRRFCNRPGDRDRSYPSTLIEEEFQEVPPAKRKTHSRKVKVVALSLGKAAARVIGLAAAVVMARFLAKEDLAAYRQTLLAYTFVAPFLQLGLAQGIYYFLPGEKVRIRGRVIDAITVLGLMGLLMAAFIGFGGNELLARRFSNPQVADLLLWIIPFTIITLPGNLTPKVLVAREHVMLASVFGVAKQLIIGVCTILPVLVWRNAEAPLIGHVLAGVLMGVAAIALMIRSTPNDSVAPSARSMGEMVKFSLPLGFAAMLGTMSMSLDKVIVGMMSPPEEFAVYVLGAMELPAIAILTGSITAVMLVEMRRAVAAGNVAEAVRLFRLSAEKTSFILLPLMMFFMVAGASFMQTLYGRDYIESSIPFRIYLLLLPVRTIFFSSILVAMGHSMFILKRSSAVIVLNLALSITLVYFFGPWAAALATVAVVLCCAAVWSIRFICREANCRWTDLIPVRHYLTVCRDTAVPAGVIFLVHRYFGTDRFYEAFGVSAVLFGLFMMYYLNGRIYRLDQLKRFLRRG